MLWHSYNSNGTLITALKLSMTSEIGQKKRFRHIALVLQAVITHFKKEYNCDNLSHNIMMIKHKHLCTPRNHKLAFRPQQYYTRQ